MNDACNRTNDSLNMLELEIVFLFLLSWSEWHRQKFSTERGDCRSAVVTPSDSLVAGEYSTRNARTI